MYTIIDLRGFIIRAYISGKDQDGILDEVQDEVINSAQYGFDRFLERYLSEWAKSPTDKIIFALEGGNDLRRAMYPEYKANRSKTWSEVQTNEINKAQAMVEECLTKMGFLLCRQEGMEADDVIAYLTKDLQGKKLVHTVDGDLKLLSALPDTTVMYHPQTSDLEVFTGEVEGLPARYLTLNKSIVGDSSDNYKGIPGMGPKAWENLVEAYGVDGLKELDKYVRTRNWDELKSDAEELGCPILQKIYDNRDSWELSYSLAKMYPNLINAVQGKKLHKLQWIKELPNPVFIQSLLDGMDEQEPGDLDWVYSLLPEYTLVTSKNLDSIMEYLPELVKDTPVIGWDYETYDPVRSETLNQAYRGKGDFVDSLSSEVVGVSFAVGKFCNDVLYFSTNHADTDNLSKEQMKEVMEYFFGLGIEMVAHNVQFEATITKTNFDLDVPYWTDTDMFAKNLFEEDQTGLKSLSKSHLDYTQQTYQEVVGELSGMHELTGEAVLHYGCDDSTITAHLLFLFRVLSELEGTRDFIEQYECMSLPLLVDGFISGVPIDLEAMQELRDKDVATVLESRATIRKILAEKCSEGNPAAASALYGDLRKFEEAKLAERGTDPDVIQQRMEALKTKLVEDSVYKDLVEIPKEVKFAPTATQLTKVLAELSGGGEAFVVSKTTVAGLTEFISGVFDLEQSEETREYLEVLAKAAGTQIANREGEDYEQLKSLSEAVLKKLAGSTKVGTELNFGSPPQNTSLLYGMLGLPIRLRTKVRNGSTRQKLGFQGGPSTDIDAMNTALAEDCSGENAWKAEVLANLVKVNNCTTRAGLYYSPYPLWMHPRDGRIHPQISQSATVTNRPTGSSPNILQVPKKDGGLIRSTFLGGETDSGEPYVYVSIDFSGQELRILASESEDPVMLDAYVSETPKELHTVTACAIAKPYISRAFPGADLSQVEWEGDGSIKYEMFKDVMDNPDNYPTKLTKIFKVVRDAAKTLNFGNAYGASAMTSARKLVIPIALAESLEDALFSKYSGILTWKQRLWKSARKLGYVTSAYGNRRHCWPNIASDDFSTKGRMERQVANFAIQGTAADILKIVMTNAYPLFKKTGSILLAPVYDEIASRVPVSQVVEYVAGMSEIMSITPPGHQVGMVPEVSIGKTWGTQVELGAFPSEVRINNVLESLE